ncbi:MAG: hypothetical protein HC800_08600 [Phormidesmis sp. RL_2_1]|nr:hypothetical protein [Phormidesmis sp. RL_2_1]
MPDALASEQTSLSRALSATLGHPFSAETLAVIASAPIQQQSALMLGSPAMMYR